MAAARDFGDIFRRIGLLERDVSALKGWRDDHAHEYRNIREDFDEVLPFVKQMRAEEDYRKRLIQDADRRFTRGEKTTALLVGVGVFVLNAATFVIAVRGGR